MYIQSSLSKIPLDNQQVTAAKQCPLIINLSDLTLFHIRGMHCFITSKFRLTRVP